ncbi:MAG: XylR N-terminal domain-containing protein [Deltaproteobacteria bacterium]|nr:XylR N-terminal domain-containing protein [Candidatus Zymogenaceae bacterium]
MKVSEFRFDEHLAFKPEQGRILFKDQRMVMMSADSFGTLLKEIIDIGGVNMARVFMRRFGETAGRNDARTIKNTLSPDTDIDWLALGPMIHSWEGIVRAVPEEINIDRDTGKFYMKGTWEDSFFAEQYLKHYGKSKDPVCWLLTGYATGYTSEFFGKKLIAKEPTCKGKGDDLCRFEITPEG